MLLYSLELAVVDKTKTIVTRVEYLISDLNVKPETIKLLEGNIEGKLRDIDLCNDFLGLKISTLTFSCSSSELIRVDHKIQDTQLL